MRWRAVLMVAVATMLLFLARPATAGHGWFAGSDLKRMGLDLHLGALGDLDGGGIGMVLGIGLGFADYAIISPSPDDSDRLATKAQLRADGWQGTAKRVRQARTGWVPGRPPDSPTAGQSMPCKAGETRRRHVLEHAGALSFEWNALLHLWNARAAARFGVGTLGFVLGLAAGVSMHGASYAGLSLRLEGAYELWPARWPGLTVFAALGSDRLGAAGQPLGLVGLRVALYGPRL